MISQNLVIVAKEKEEFQKGQELPMILILQIELFDVWVIEFISQFVSSHGMKYILIAVDYVSKWVEANMLSNNMGKSATVFMKMISCLDLVHLGRL